jgi:hypothetical protein
MKTEIRFSAWVGAALVAVIAAAQQPVPQPDNRPVQAQLPAVAPPQSAPQPSYTGRAPLQPVVSPQPQAPVFLPYVPPSPPVPQPGYAGRAPVNLLPYVAPYQPPPQTGYQGVIPRPSQNLTWTNRFRRIR